MFSALKSQLLLFFFSTLLLTVSFFALPSQAAAVTPNTEADVPKNSHTYSQTLLIDVLSALSCQLSGIDPTDPSTPCLTVNPDTHKIGYAPHDENNGQLGGLIGVLTDQIGVLYTPPASSGQYVSYLANNFGIVKPAMAADPQDGVGFNSLKPIFELWKVTLNVAYLILVLVFIFIGIAVMLRIKIDPRTVMTVQNQIPRVVISILLITLSYGIAGAMIDMMWTGTYVGINAIAQGPQDVALPTCKDGNAGEGKLSEVATTHLLNTPISYFNAVFHSKDDSQQPGKDCSSIIRGFSGGLFHVTQSVSRAIGGLVRDVITSLLGSKECKPVQAIGQTLTLGLFGSDKVKDCASAVLSQTFGFLANIISWLIILCAILISLFRVWFKLIQAYIHILFYVIAAPIWIVMGLIPGRPLGFENWVRNMAANLLVFPLTAFLFVSARIFMDVFDVADDATIDPNSTFIPPMVGNPNMEVFGTLLAFGVVLMAPGLLDLLKEKMKAQGTKIGGLATATLVAGVGAATAVPKRQWSTLTAKDQHGNATGPISSMSQNAGVKFRTGKYMPWNALATYKRAQEKSAGKEPEKKALSWTEKTQEKKEMSRQGLGYMTAEQWEKQNGKKLPDWVNLSTRGRATGQMRPQGPSVMGGHRSAAGQGEPGDVAAQAHQPEKEPKGPQSPMHPGGFGAAKNQAGGGKTGSMSVNRLDVGKLVAGQITEGGVGRHEPEPGKPPAPPTWGSTLNKAAKSVGQGWNKMGQQEEHAAESARTTELPHRETHGTTSEAEPEVARTALARDIAHQQERIKETHGEQSEHTTVAPEQQSGGMHPGGFNTSTSIENIKKNIIENVHTTHTEDGVPSHLPEKDIKGVASPSEKKPDDHKEK